MTTKILKVKYHDRIILPLSKRHVISKRTTNPKYYFIIDKKLDSIFRHFKVKSQNIAKIEKKYIVINQNNLINLDETHSQLKNHIFINLNADNENFIKEEISKNDDLKRAFKDKEFEITTKESL